MPNYLPYLKFINTLEFNIYIHKPYLKSDFAMKKKNNNNNTNIVVLLWYCLWILHSTQLYLCGQTSNIEIMSARYHARHCIVTLPLDVGPAIRHVYKINIKGHMTALGGSHGGEESINSLGKNWQILCLHNQPSCTHLAHFYCHVTILKFCPLQYMAYYSGDSILLDLSIYVLKFRSYTRK